MSALVMTLTIAVLDEVCPSSSSSDGLEDGPETGELLPTLPQTRCLITIQDLLLISCSCAC